MAVESVVLFDRDIQEPQLALLVDIYVQSAVSGAGHAAMEFDVVLARLRAWKWVRRGARASFGRIDGHFRSPSFRIGWRQAVELSGSRRVACQVREHEFAEMQVADFFENGGAHAAIADVEKFLDAGEVKVIDQVNPIAS